MSVRLSVCPSVRMFVRLFISVCLSVSHKHRLTCVFMYGGCIHVLCMDLWCMDLLCTCINNRDTHVSWCMVDVYMCYVWMYECMDVCMDLLCIDVWIYFVVVSICSCLSMSLIPVFVILSFLCLWDTDRQTDINRRTNIRTDGQTDRHASLLICSCLSMSLIPFLVILWFQAIFYINKLYFLNQQKEKQGKLCGCCLMEFATPLALLRHRVQVGTNLSAHTVN